MAEAEDVLVDAARHATVFIRDLWHQHARENAEGPVALASIAHRLDLFLTAVCGVSLPLRVALPPARPTLLHRLVHRHVYPLHRQALPATNDSAIWLPGDAGTNDPGLAAELYRAMALQQAQRAMRGCTRALLRIKDPLLRDTALVLEAREAEADVASRFPGVVPSLQRLRDLSLSCRPSLASLAPARRPLEQLVCEILEKRLVPARDRRPTTLDDSIAAAAQVIAAWNLDEESCRRLGAIPLFRDWWTVELRAEATASYVMDDTRDAFHDEFVSVRSARMSRRPDRRDATEDEDERAEPAAWMIQQDAPHESAEDPFGLQRPVDRDDETSAEEYGDMLSELSSARTIAAPDPAREVLLSDDPPVSRAMLAMPAAQAAEISFRYPEWDFTRAAYVADGVTVRVRPPALGEQSWVDAALARHRTQLDGIRRQFEALRPERIRLRRQVDGEDIDLDACVESRADQRAGGFLRDALYETRRPGRRSIAVSLLVDISGSTDAWIGGDRRVIDVEREALLLVSMALEQLRGPFAITAFSGEGPHGVTVRTLKNFDEPCGIEVALRIAALEPEHYTRAGAALRHATAMLMRQPAEHRLLLLLSDGKPNDSDRYEGRFGVEDMRQAVIETRLQGIFPFCLTIDRQAPRYLPNVFGTHGYALLSAPERLPMVLLEWTRRLLGSM